MKRFFGMMPSKEVEMEKEYVDKNNSKILIQAGKNGWTVIYADNSTSYKDVEGETLDNFNEAYNVAIKNLGNIKEV